MRSRYRQSANFTHNAIFSPETAQAKAEAAIWLMRLLNTSIPLDDRFFAFLGWCAGGLNNLSRRLQEDANALSGRRSGILAAKKAVANLGNYSEKTLDDAFENLVEEHPVALDMIRESIVQTLQDAIAHAGTERASLKATQRRIQKFFGLCEESMRLCRLAFMTGSYQAVENYIEDCLQIQDFGNRRLMAHMLNIPTATCQEYITQMTNMGILDVSNRQIRLCYSIHEAWQQGDAQSLQNTFCKSIQGKSLPMEQFHIPADEKEHVLRLLRQSHTPPVHILLYGAPGTGKTSFVRSLAATLKVRAWAVPCKEDDTSQDRRAALTACLRMASRHEGAFVLVDEAERLLDTAISFDKSSSSKAWLNDFLERKNQRVIWISNTVGHLDQAVRRRFTYSIHFEALGRRERSAIWEDVAQRQNVTKRRGGSHS